MNYINEKYVHNLLANHYSLGVKHLITHLERLLSDLEVEGDSMTRQLLRHNLSGHRKRELSEFAKIDVDVVIELDNASKKVSVDLRDYRKHKEFERTFEERRVVMHIVNKHSEKTTWVIHLPLQAMMKGFGDPTEGYQCYSHAITMLDEDGKVRGKEMFYCGITSRSWLTRMAEHFREINSGSNKLFHKQWREFQGNTSVMLNSELIALNHSYDAAMAWEEWIVDRYMNENCSLNMIPGGFKGLKYLHKLGYLSRLDSVSLKDREAAISRYAQEHPRAGVPNLLIGQMWLNDEYYAKVIGNRGNTFSADDVALIRSLAQSGKSTHEIAHQFGIENTQRIKNVLLGKTYYRM